MAVDKRTPHRDYPLPDESNLLEQDVQRLANALTQIDNDIQSHEQQFKAQQSQDTLHSQELQTLQSKTESHTHTLKTQNKVLRRLALENILGESLY